MFSKIFQSLKKLYTQFITPLQQFFRKERISDEDLAQLRILLIEADLGHSMTERLMGKLKNHHDLSGETARMLLRTELFHILHSIPQPGATAPIIMLVGINGSGKTTCAAKLAYQAQQEHKKPLVVAADTFRAAATEQLVTWGNRFQFPVVTGAAQQDPAAVIFKGCTEFKSGAYDTLIIDTAGRLQTKSHLMDELAKMRRVVGKQFPATPITTLLTIDSMLGQNSLQQAQIFRETALIDGIILTKLDGTGKGGVVFSIAEQLKLPVYFITTGEGIDHMQPFDATAFIDALMQPS
jgi:fused signal recognition particle receptor